MVLVCQCIKYIKWHIKYMCHVYIFRIKMAKKTWQTKGYEMKTEIDVEYAYFTTKVWLEFDIEFELGKVGSVAWLMTHQGSKMHTTWILNSSWTLRTIGELFIPYWYYNVTYLSFWYVFVCVLNWACKSESYSEFIGCKHCHVHMRWNVRSKALHVASSIVQSSFYKLWHV